MFFPQADGLGAVLALAGVNIGFLAFPPGGPLFGPLCSSQRGQAPASLRPDGPA
jgi:hypothetical protein